MLGSLRITRLRAAGAFFIAVLSLIPVLLSGGTAHAVSFDEIWMSSPGATFWCITALNPNKAGSELVLGVCADAPSQLFELVNVVPSGPYYELKNWGGLCVTFDMANGGPDGAYALLGNCVGAQNQLFEEEEGFGGGAAWVMPYRVDNLGRHVAVDNEGNNFVVNNHIDESYYSSALPSESWQGLGVG
jgi:hypothetical protein